jgi:hypothetical protein
MPIAVFDVENCVKYGTGKDEGGGEDIKSVGNPDKRLIRQETYARKERLPPSMMHADIGVNLSTKVIKVASPKLRTPMETRDMSPMRFITTAFMIAKWHW